MLHKKFVQKYVHYAKSQVTPILTDDAREYIATEYAQLRAKGAESNRTLPVTARQLETLIRLATAHAKVRTNRRPPFFSPPLTAFACRLSPVACRLSPVTHHTHITPLIHRSA